MNHDIDDDDIDDESSDVAETSIDVESDELQKAKPHI